MPKCEFCKSEARGYVLQVPLCLPCMLASKLALDKLIATVKEDDRITDDKKEITELEKRYSMGMNVKGSD